MRIEARLHYGVYRFAICSTDNGLIWGVRRGALVKEVDGMGCVEVFFFFAQYFVFNLKDNGPHYAQSQLPLEFFFIYTV